MIQFIEQWFETAAKKNWLRTISKEVDKRNRLKRKLNAQTYIVSKLVEHYNELYSENIGISEGEQR